MKLANEIAHIIDPNGVYSLDGAQRALGLTRTTLRREVRMGRLRVAKRAGRYFIVGEWLLDWLREGEVGRQLHRTPAPVGHSVGGAA
jgi:hypothetical protein